jgi:predicted phosphodiesterase
MKFAIISDIHANLEALRATLQHISERPVDRVVCLGDIVGYNTNPAECVALLRQVDPLCVAGSHERATCGQITTYGFGDVAARAIAWTRGRLGSDTLEFLAGLPLQLSIQDHLVAVHGALHPDTGCELVRLDNDDRRRLSFNALAAHPSRARVCAFGHTHHLGIFELRDGVVRARTGDEIALHDDAYYLINPGTVGQPRVADRRATYLVLDVARQVVTAHRVKYDFSVPVAKTREAGLLPRFSSLPMPVRDSLKRAARSIGVYGHLRSAYDHIKWMGR